MGMLKNSRTSRLLAVLLGIVLMALWCADAEAALRSFSRRYNTNANGDIIIIGNALMTCNPAGPTGGATCLAARNRTAVGADLNNNNHTMMNIDADSDSGTFNSSSATLSLPAGSTVLWAGLYWAGESDNLTRSQALFATPGSFGYSSISASQVDFEPGATADRYSAFADVTSLVQAAGSGTYWTANVQTAIQANNDFAGWSLVVVYGNMSANLRNLAVFDGMETVTGAPGVRIDVSGFLSPLSGPVTTRLGAVVLEGDANLTGDYLSMNGTQLQETGIRPLTNFYNSYLTDNGAVFTAKTPDYLNQLGFDIASRVNVPAGIVLNGDTSAYFNVATGGETVYPTVLTFATDLYVPIVTPNLTKTITDLNGGTLVPGDTVRFTVSMSNTGIDTAVNLTLTDAIPANTSYVPGSLRIISGANSGSKTDAGGDDQAEYINSGTPRVVVRLGNNATAGQGGELPYLSTTSISFDATINAATPAGTILSNTALISYNGQTIATTFAGASAAATATIVAPPTITKSFAPNPIAVNGNATMSIVVANPAANPITITGISFSDSYPAGMQNSPAPNAAVSCTPGSAATLSGGAANGTSIGMSGGSILAGGSCTVSVAVTSAAPGNYTNTTSTVTTSNGGSAAGASATLSVGKPAVTLKSFTPATILAGGTSTVSLTVTNPNASALSNVAFSDSLTNMVVAGSPNVTNSCGGTVTAVGASISLAGGSMAASSTCTITVDITSSSTGIHPNQTSGVTSAQTGGPGLSSNIAYLTVIGAPVASTSFSPTSIRTSAGTISSLLTITVANPNSTTTISGLSFTDTYPSNLVNASIPNPAISCSAGSSATRTGGVAGTGTIGMNAGTLAPGGSCTVTVNVSSNTNGSYANSSGTVTTANAGSGAAASATLNVSNLAALTATKAFAVPASIAVGATKLMTITLTNPNTAGNTVTGIAFTDTYPSGLTNAAAPNAATTCSGGTATAAAGGGSISLSNASLAGGASCTVTVTVTSATKGTYFNVLPAGSITTANAGTSSADVSATLTVTGSPIAAKYFSPNTIQPNGNSTLTVVISNPNAAAATGVQFTDSYPSGLINTTPVATNISCTAGSTAGSISAAAGGGSLALGSTTIAANGNCTITSTVTAASVGSYANTLASGSVTSTNAGSNLLPASATLYVATGPTTSKYFSPNPVVPGQSSTLTITVSNPFSTDMTAVALTDSYPAGMLNAAPADPLVSCTGGSSGTLTGGVPAAATVGITNGTIKPGQSCTITSKVAAAAFGNYANSTGTVTTTSHGNDTAGGSSVLTVMGAPTATKSFTPAMTGAGETSVITFTLTNPNTTTPITGLAFTDTYPAGMVTAATPALSSTCPGATLTAAAGGTSFAISGGTINTNSSCSATVTVTAAAAGSYLNSSGPIGSGNAGTGSAATATLTVLQKPTIAAAFAPTSIPVNSTSQLTLTLTNPNSAQALSAVAFSTTLPSGLTVANPPAAASDCGGTLTGTADASTAVSLANGTLAAGSSCSITLSVKAAAGGSYDVTTSGVTSLETVGAGLPSNTVTLTVTTGSALGTVYNDANHNGGQNSSESGAGLPAAWVKLASRSGASCSSPALSATAVDATSGAYSISGIAPGDYCLILAGNANLADVTASPAAGWLLIEGASGIRLVTVGAGPLPNQNFGLYNGSRVAGRVFADTGTGGGTANNGVQDGTEIGLAGTLIRATDNSGGTTYDSTTANGSGDFILWIPASAGNTPVRITETNPSGYLSTGGSAGTSGGSYDRAGDAVLFTNATGSGYSGLLFGDVPDNRFLSDNAASALPGTVLFHSHSFTAGSSGSVSFSTSAVASPNVPGWSEVFYRDSNCSGTFDAGEPQITAAISLAAGEQLCLLVKEFVPANAPIGASNLVTTTATFSYPNASPALSRQTARTDNTSVGAFSGAGLTLTKTVDSATALPGASLTYTIAYGNSSSGPLNNIVIHDTVPAFTSLSVLPANPCCVNPTSACLGSGLTPFPASITACAASVSGDAITWTLTGTLAPGATGQVKFRVTVQP